MGLGRTKQWLGGGWVVVAVVGATAAAASLGAACKQSEHKPPTFTGGGGGDDASSSATMSGSTSSGFGDMCDTDLAIDGADAMDGARAIGLCSGVTEALWVKSDGSPLGMGDGGLNGDGDLALGHGVLSKFGANVVPREGERLLALSSGSARNPTDPGFHSVNWWWKDSNPHPPPTGFPKASPSCAVMSGSPYDSVGLKVTFQPPPTAKSLAFDFNFYTFEFPQYICTGFNDFFVALMTPTPAGLSDANISFDEMGNNISVNAGFLKVCHPQQASNMQMYACPDGPDNLTGTGFDTTEMGVTDNSASTNWLTTTAPVDDPTKPITLVFTIWDAGDGRLDSTVLIDNFRFELDATIVGTQPTPK